ncbi:hydrolase [Staphylococcus piscifermentans]|uniref:Haloacid dehalogenase n=1 Tax=Staphylococcus piscifermentans TaxID=70258 RepID=A0A239TT52_9STAP|nr:HAD family hydrolase [Staphylococcus piscifermentans]RTX82999.1 HAD family phosphatase [Staphylococcus piscifermentans]GEP84909.1 haloacid dehalogenase [Staphylococcus piscifermentans]SNV00639.1 hydrolase [Staphylococcus piscifermentans]
MDNVQAIFLDMDGTILQHNNKVSDETAEIIKKLRQVGYKVFIATGRSFDEIKNLTPEGFEIDGVISSNGTRGDAEGKMIFAHSLTYNAVQQIIKEAKAQHIYYEVFPFSGKRMILNEDYEWITKMIEGDTPPNNVSISEWNSRKTALNGNVDWVDEIPETKFSKIYMFTPDLEKVTSFREHLIEEKDTLQISVSNSSRYNAETMAAGIDKGTGIKEMIEYFNIPQSATLVIGDSDNDRSMFAFGHYTVAMKNARPEIQALAKDVTSYDNEENGAARYLEEHFLK